ncbi:AarF/ABC1/UbiB kinase family protein [Demequina sp. TTPB684]|uniref:ABC1 kinase family protein n=1 Tax=unclassified Demequina TaxID=2620311 RepID=UPI001CF29103|nr:MULTISPECIES: AarF/UbiB family protein [unclassified Demequina]MCB2413778.1 AarF/ABC1/UbiB kinase family protein [Demequina sp. TTPB684]UPU89314.1 AarF/UbiB family protein [Demequina sp. TMPB413]
MPDVIQGRARYRRILRFAAWHLAVTWWYELFLPSVGMARIAERTRAARMHRFARRFRVLAVSLGGLMIKLGQFMSSRLDVLPPEITKELEDLQDEVPPAPFAAIRELAEQELGVRLDRVFAEVDPEPIAAASLGQAYRARLSREDAHVAGFEAVVVKVQRPGIGDIVDVDLAALRKVGGWLSRVRLVSNRVDMPTLVEEFAITSLDEIDYLKEGQNAERFAENFAGDDRVKVPAVVWERASRRVLTLEDVTAIKINDKVALHAAGINPADVAPEFAAVMFDQLFLHGFFHADPHPGNLFVTPREAEPGKNPWTLTFVDFGMMGEVPVALRATLRKLVIAAASRDGKGMVAAMNEAGVLLPSADTAELERVMTEVFARFGGMGFAELRELDPREFTDFAMQFSDVMLTLPFQLPENFLLVIRAVSLTSGMCSSLDQTYNLWDSVEPYAQQLLSAEGGNLAREVAKEALEIAGLAWRLPKRLDAVLTKAEEGTLPLSVPRLEAAVARADRTGKRAVSAVLFGSLLIAGVLARPDDAGMGTALMAASLLPLAHALFGGRRRR